MNNRKRTKGRKIQAIEVPLTLAKINAAGFPMIVKNKHKKAGKTIQVKHLL